MPVTDNKKEINYGFKYYFKHNNNSNNNKDDWIKCFEWLYSMCCNRFSVAVSRQRAVLIKEINYEFQNNNR